MSVENIVSIVAALGYFIFIIYTRKSTNLAGYSVANRSVGYFMIFASLSANFIGPGFTLGLTQKGFSSGYFYLFIAGAYGIGKFFEGYFIAPKLRNKFKDAISIGDVVAGHSGHNSKTLQLIVGLLSFGLLIGLSVVMSKAAGEVVNSFLNIPKIYGIVFVTILVTSYSVFGGLKSTMMTDTVQFLIFMFLLPLLLIIVILSNDFDSSTFMSNARNLTEFGFQSNSVIIILGMVFSWGLGEMLMPFTVNTILASKNSDIAKKALTSSGILMIFWLAIMLTLGILAKTVLGNIESNDQVLLNLGRSFYGPFFFGLFTVAIIGVIMSSQDALINCSSVVFINDVINIRRNLSEHKQFRITKLAGILVGILSIALATYIPSIIDGLLFFYNIWVPTVLIVAFFSIVIEKPYAISAYVSIFVGLLTTILWNYSPLKVVPNVIAGLVLSSTSYLLVHYILHKKSKKRLGA